MRVVASSAPTDVYGGSFTGGAALSMLREAPDASAPDVALVSIPDGSVTCWHSHPGGQLIWVVSGHARVGVRGGDETLLDPGTLIEAPSGEEHWHGAAPGADAVLLCFTWGTTAWTDEAPVDAEGRHRAGPSCC
ncbi:cupin domain-containing protein [Streptomyces sp. NPDC056227]|uniref:cupin domain-containing protein n=1 Tax=Streptomyces sp. NPDC056227 TaxID=3345753 RepID=UPI0035D6546F